MMQEEPTEAAASQAPARADQALQGRREAALLALPSVRRLADLLAERCREPSWVRMAVASLDRFRVMTSSDLEPLLAQGRADFETAETSLRRFAAAMDGRAPEQIAALAFGAKVWWRVNDVPVSWRPLSATRVQAAPQRLQVASGLPTLALIGSGLNAEELSTVRIGDLGSLDSSGRIVADVAAEPLGVRFVSASDAQEWIGFLSPAAREAVLARVDDLGGSVAVDPAALLVDPDDVTRAAARDAALIGAGNFVNVSLCRATGDFFRSWGMPGARFEERVYAAADTGDPPSATDTSTPPERRPR